MLVRPPTLADLDPQQAWEPYRPSAEQPWNRRWAGHLLRRAAFGAPPLQSGATYGDAMESVIRQGVDATIDQLFAAVEQAGAYDQLMDDLAPGGSERYATGRDPLPLLQAWWLHRIVRTPAPLRERMTLFWHNHFATSIVKVKQTDLMVKQNQLLRRHALGKFPTLLLEVSKDPAMLLWLDSNSSVRGRPNENYARELLELFTLGVGHYTEDDVKAAARAFTGWHATGDRRDDPRFAGVRSGEPVLFRFNAGQHDAGPKTFLGQTGNWDGGDVLRITLEQPAAGLHLARKLYRAFISDVNIPPDALLEPLAHDLRTHEYDVGRVLRRMLQSRHFFSAHAYRQKIKGPVDYVVGLARALDVELSPATLVRAMDGLGQKLFAPPTVKGWDGGKSWLNSATLLARHNLAWSAVHATSLGNTEDAPRFPGDRAADPWPVPALEAVRHRAGPDPEAQVGFVVDWFLQGDCSAEARATLVRELKRELNAPERLRRLVHLVLTMPEYQLA